MVSRRRNRCDVNLVNIFAMSASRTAEEIDAGASNISIGLQNQCLCDRILLCGFHGPISPGLRLEAAWGMPTLEMVMVPTGERSLGQVGDHHRRATSSSHRC